MVENNMPLDVLKEHIKSALKWASELNDTWTNTMIGDFIDREKGMLKKATEAEDWNAVYTSMIDLVDLCEHAEGRLRNE